LWGEGLGGARRARLLLTEGRSTGPSTFASVFCAVIVVFVISVLILIHFVVVILSLCMYAQQVFPMLFTGVLDTIACIWRRGVNGVFSAGLQWSSGFLANI